MLDSVIKAKEKYYLQTILEECKYEQKKIKIDKKNLKIKKVKKIKNLTDDDLEKIDSDESDSESESDTDNDEYDE